MLAMLCLGFLRSVFHFSVFVSFFSLLLSLMSTNFATYKTLRVCAWVLLRELCSSCESKHITSGCEFPAPFWHAGLLADQFDDDLRIRPVSFGGF